ncbi:cytochrome P450 4c21-like [Aedes albopictus]|uniref:Cytochrome n=1 Tax=Aedes albopictus TaxID=7160 RepID=A0ABM1ZJ51_AEDAL
MVQTVIVLLLLPVIVYLVQRWRLRRFNQISSELPGPVNYPLIGCSHLLIGKSKAQLFAFLNSITKTYSSPCRGWLGPELFVFIDNPEDLQVVLNSSNCLEKADVYRFIRSLRGLLTSPVSVWKDHRKLLAPCFSPSILSSFMPIFNEKCRVLVECVGRNTELAEYDPYADVSKCTLDMICGTFFGTKMIFQNSDGTEFINIVQNGCELINHRIYSVWLHPEWIYQKTKYYQEEKKYFDKFYKILNKILSERQTLRKDLKTSEINENASLNKPLIFIDQVQKLSEEAQVFDDTDVLHELSTIIIGGNETSALTLTHVILLLAMHQDIQEKVYDEIVNVLGSTDPSITVDNEHLSKLSYMEMVIKESMRLLPIAAVFGRKCTAPTRISKTTIPEGANLILGAFNLHRNPKYWGPHADQFDPNHFLPDRVAERHPYSFLPFSGGPRNCIGYKYAMMSMKIMLCYLLRAYRFRSPLRLNQLQLSMSLTLKITNRNMMTVERRSM